MVDVLIFMSQRPVVITLAVLGALLVTAGSLVQKPARSQTNTAAGSRSGAKSGLAKHLTTSGYVITFASILLFIIAGFVSDLRP